MSIVIDTELNMTNYAEFKSHVMKYGFSVNNFYDVQINIASGIPLHKELLSVQAVGRDQLETMRLYTDETSMPGLQMSTGEYRINNSPQLKYTYGAVFSEVSMSFMMDADSIIKNVFDIWTNFIYNYSGGSSNWSKAESSRFRSNYRDDYTVDIDIIKYESATSSAANRSKNTVVSGRDTDKWNKSFKLWDIIPDKQHYTGSNYRLHNQSSVNRGEVTFRKAVPVQATKLFNAFPVNIASVPLTFGDTSMNKLSVGFEYESHTTTAITNGRIGSGLVDIINE